MKKKYYLEVELPWQIEVGLVVAAVGFSIIAIALASAFLHSAVTHSIEELYAIIGGVAHPVIPSLFDAWPLAALALALLSFRVYAFFKSIIARNWLGM